MLPAAALFALAVLAEARERILRRVVVDEDTGCWLWTGALDGRYGNVKFLGHYYKAHRLAYMAFVGRFPRNRPYALHGCDNTRCCRPHEDHVRPGTESENLQEAWDRSRRRLAGCVLRYVEPPSDECPF